MALPLQIGEQDAAGRATDYATVPQQLISSGRQINHRATISERKRKRGPPMATSKTIITLMLITLVSVIGTGCSDDSTSPVAVVPTPVVDTAPPAVPANLDIQYVNGAIELSWDTNTTDADLDGFILTRENKGETIYLFSSPYNVSSFVDNSELDGTSTYVLYSVDFSQNQSAAVSISYTAPRLHTSDVLVDY